MSYSLLAIALAFALAAGCVTAWIRISGRRDVGLRRVQQRFLGVYAASPAGIVETDLEQRVLHCNAAYERMTGLSESQLVGRHTYDLLHPDSPPPDFAGLESLKAGKQASHSCQRVLAHTDGSGLPVQLDWAVIRDAHGRASGLAGIVTDISARTSILAELSAANSELARREHFTDALLETVDVGIVFCDEKGESLIRNRAERRMVGLDTSAHGLLPDSSAHHIDVFDADGKSLLPADQPLTRLLRGEDVGEIDLLLGPNGGPHHEVVLRGSQIRDADGRVLGAVVSLNDVSVQRRVARDLDEAREGMQRANTFLQAVLTASPDCTFVTNLSTGAIVYGNEGREALGFSTGQLESLGSNLVESVIHPEDRQLLVSANVAALDLADGELLERQYRARHVDGGWRWLNRRVTPFRRDERGEVIEVLGVVRDITEVANAREKLHYAALHDDLTGLPNRTLLLDRLETALLRSARDRREVTVLFCDLDGFKQVNDTAGHSAGDVVLLETTRRIVAALRVEDTVARVGGDEFVVVLEPWNRTSTGPQSLRQDRLAANRVAQRIAAVIREPVTIDGVAHCVSASIGVVHSKLPVLGELSTVTAKALIQDADTAMYLAKSAGKDCLQVFGPGHPEDTVDREPLDSLLAQAFLTAAVPSPRASPASEIPLLSAAFQPIFDPGNGGLVGFEALARLCDANGQQVPPSVFIRAAESAGKIGSLGRLMLDLACGQLAEWRAGLPGLEGITVAVNVSAAEAGQSSLGADVQAALQAHGLEPADLVLELTETTILQASDSTISALAVLRAQGVGIAIDNFGTGYTSPRFLADLPVSAIKIDRSLTAGLPNSVASRRIVDGIAALAMNCGLTCTAEGVETEEQRSALPEGVRLQGFLLGRPQKQSLGDVIDLSSAGATANPAVRQR